MAPGASARMPAPEPEPERQPAAEPKPAPDAASPPPGATPAPGGRQADRESSQQAAGGVRGQDARVSWLANPDHLHEHVRAHDALRHALESERHILDDEEAAGLLRDAGRGVLSALHRLLEDEALWAKLASTNRAALTPGELALVERFADAGLPMLLTSLGYSAPPSVTELVDGAVSALALAHVQSTDRYLAGERVREARRDLGSFAVRLGRLVAVSQGTMPPSLARRVLRKADQEADAVFGAVTPVLIGAGAEVLLPGAGLAAKIVAALGGVLAQRVLGLRPRMADADRDAPVSGHAAMDKGYRQARRLVEMAEGIDTAAVASDADRDLLIAQSWAVEQAVRDVLALGTPAEIDPPALTEALDALKALRGAAVSGGPLAAAARAASVLSTRI